ncbi:MAG TPA: trypsin-like peptidase domain-containing protein [Rhizobacter sp.]|nr:trypsin-like peptidase domain-containing protein [Rhizobacter sp.]
MRPARCIAAALLVGAALGVVRAHEEHALASPALLVLLSEADSALVRGESEVARSAYERAAALQHSADIEVGWVRAQMQAGDYRRALAFAAHTAGAHPDDSEGAALYAWLLFLGGQEAVARQTLERALQRLPQDALLIDTRSRLQASPASDTTPWPFTPPALGDRVAASARGIGNALLLADAQHALVPLSLLRGSGSLWVRNGLGRSARAELLQRDEAQGLAVLRLARPLDAPIALALAPREAFSGSPGFVVGFAAPAGAQPAWPQLSTGFLGRPAADAQTRRLGIEVPSGSAGAPVFDNAGRLVGLVLPAEANRPPGLSGVAALRGWVTAAAAAAAPAEPATLPLDALYEQALRSSLQLLHAD